VKLSDEELRSLYQERTARGAERRGCADAAALVRVAAREASESERAEVALHVARCSDCAAELLGVRRSLGELEASEAATALEAPAGKERALGSGSWVLAAAAVLLLVLLPLVLWRAGDIPGDATRGDPALDVQPAPNAELAASPRELVWPAEPGATGYRVRLFDARAETIWESGRTDEPRVELPPDAIRSIEAAGEGAAFVWSVEVEGASARDRLGPFWFRVVGGAPEAR
ncbi:MAG: hypothetical protein ACRD3V_02450, partial [Vicinamibacteria bacterium]